MSETKLKKLANPTTEIINNSELDKLRKQEESVKLINSSKKSYVPYKY